MGNHKDQRKNKIDTIFQETLENSAIKEIVEIVMCDIDGKEKNY